MKTIAKYSGCFVCGDQNRIGLKIPFYYVDGMAICDLVADEQYAGYRHVFHGGITATILDEVMIKSLLAENLLAVTAELTVRFRKPVFCGDHLRFEGRQTDRKGPLSLTSGRAVNQRGEVVAEAVGKYILPDPSLAGRLQESLEP